MARTLIDEVRICSKYIAKTMIYAKIAIIAIFLSSVLPMSAQEILLRRSDVDSVRSGFVTATYSFGIDIITRNLKRANLVSFELLYTNAEHIHFSGYTVINFGDSSGAQVQVKVNKLSNTGIISAAVYSHDSIGAQGYDHPEVIHLEFVVSQSAVHGRPVTMSFIEANAVVTLDNNEGANIPLNSESTIYIINSYITVWPGDANNDGKVSVSDYNRVALFFQSDSAKKAWKSFKRKNASTKWIPQRVLSWDNDTAAYADCDGNGEITVEDMAVIRLNIDSIHFGKMNKEGNILGKDIFPNVQYPPEAIRIPLKIGYSEHYIAAIGRLAFNDEQSKYFLGLEAGDIFSGNEAILFFNNDDKNIEFFISSNINDKGGDEGIIVYLVFDKAISESAFASPESDFKSLDLKGMSHKGYMFPLGVVSDVNSKEISDWDINIYYKYGSIVVDVPEVGFNGNVKLYNARGSNIAEFTVIEGRNELRSLFLTSGIYYAVIECKQNYRVFPVLVVE